MLLEQLQKDMVGAMKARDKVRKDAISTLVSAVKKLAIDEGCRDSVPEELVDRAVLRELKLVKEQLETCPVERVELKDGYKATFDIISEYAPAMMSEEEIKTFILTNFAEAVATKNKGMIMKGVMGKLKGKADGALINQVVGDMCK